MCSAATTAVTGQTLTPAGGHFFVALQLTNRGSQPCRTQGYPGVAVLNAAGQQILQAQRTPRGYGGGLPTGTENPPAITLQPGQTATALLEGQSHHQPGGQTCPAEPALLVTPPNTTTSTRVSVQTFDCQAPEIHPLLPGTTGSAS